MQRPARGCRFATKWFKGSVIRPLPAGTASAAIDEAVGDLAEGAFAFLERLVAVASVLDQEAPAQAVVGEELVRLGFDVSTVEVAPHVDGDPRSGVAQERSTGGHDVIGRAGPDRGRSLLVNGHVDVVPAGEPRLWARPPFSPTRAHGWLVGRGAGDMKAGFAMATLAIEALQRAAPDAIAGPLTVVSAIEEECTGNGTLAACRAGHLADGIVIVEPTGLELLVAGIGVLWVDIEITGRSAHVEAAAEGTSAVAAAEPVLAALRALEDDLNSGPPDPVLAGIERPYAVNVGTVQVGDWPSSVPATAHLGVRVGFPRGWTVEQAEARVADAVRGSAGAHPWLRDHPPAVRPSGLRAEGYAVPATDPLVRALAEAHRSAHGSEPRVVAAAATTDARHYVNGFGRPAVCYGPLARDIHGVDERVSLESVVAGARTLARFIADWYRGPA